jgi:ABC-type amino acid transport substrate-binding protein
MRHRTWWFSALALPAIGLLVAGCSTFQLQKPLRVGVTPDFPPIIAKENGTIGGLEADFAVRLAADLGRKLKLVDLPWERQVPALLSGDIDLIMSGMSVSDIRRVRVDFCDPYMKSGLMALISRKAVDEFVTAEDIAKAGGRVGAKKGTMADVYVQENCRLARLVHFTIPNDAALALKNRKLDIFIHDAPSIWWLASKYEADLSVVPVRLTEEELAWGIRPGNAALKQRVNEILARWRTDGTLQRTLDRYVPYMK